MGAAETVGVVGVVADSLAGSLLTTVGEVG